MFGYPKRPVPPTWKILLYCIGAVAILAGSGWLYSHFVGGRYDADAPPSSSESSAAPPEASGGEA